MGKLDGHCLCGSITYECDAEPIMTGICHCTDCQRSSASAFSIVVGVPRDELTIHGEMKVFETIGDDRGPRPTGSSAATAAHQSSPCSAMPRTSPGSRREH
jgi:glutathione-dependent formaldehyde-activating enzyme